MPEKERIAIVLSNKMQKTIVVQIERVAKHPKFGKIMKKFKKFKVHDEKNTAKVGDRVRVVETRPLSRDKHWRLVEILSHGHLQKSVAQETEAPAVPEPVKS